MALLLGRAARAIWEGCRDAEKLAAALILCGVVESAAALWLIVFKQPEGILLHHGKALFWLYYGVLIAIVLVGFVQAWIGVWVAGDVPKRRAVGKTAMALSILPLVVVAGLGGFAFAVPK